MISLITIIILMALAYVKIMELANERDAWKELAKSQKKDLKEWQRKFAQFKAAYSKVYDFANECPERFKKEQIQAINEELRQLNGRVLNVDDVKRKTVLKNARKYLEALDVDKRP